MMLKIDRAVGPRRLSLLCGVALGALWSGAAGAAVTCTVGGTATLINCDATFVQAYGIGGASSLTVTDTTTGSVELRLDPAVVDGDGPFSQTLTVTGTSVLDRADYSAVIMQTNRARRDATVILGSDVQISGRGGGIGAVWVRNDTSGDISIQSDATVTAFSGGGDGITATTNLGAVTLTNSGTVISADGRGLYADGGFNNLPTSPVDVFVTNTGDVTGYLAGIRVIDYQGHGKADNQGTVESTIRQAIVVYSANGQATIVNSGTATSNDDVALYAATDNGDIEVTNSGMVTAADDAGISGVRDGYSGIRAVADISGDIVVTNDTGGSIAALDTSGTAANDAAIFARTPAGSVTLTNNADVHGRFAITGISSDSLVSLDNSGMVEGEQGGVYLNGATNSLTNSGSITANAGTAVSTGNGNSTITNSGTVSAVTTAIAFGSGDDRLQLQSGYSITGIVDAGTGDDTLELGLSTGSSFDVGLIGATSSQYRGFETIEKSGSGTLTLSGNNGTSDYDWRVSAGTLIGATTSLGGADVQIDSGATLRLSQSGSSSMSGVLSGTGTLQKQGTGNAVLSGDSSGFAGTTEVSAGSLTVSGQLGGAIDVLSGGAVAGAGSVGDVTVASGGRLTGQNTGLTMDSLTLDSGAFVRVRLGAPTTSQIFTVNGDLTLDGTLEITATGAFGDGLYRLISYGGTLTDSGLAIDSTSAAAISQNLTVQTSVAGQVNLIAQTPSSGGGGGTSPPPPPPPISPPPPPPPPVSFTFWDAGAADNGVIEGGSGRWTATSTTWTTSDGKANGALSPTPTFAIFAGTGGAVQADASEGALSVTGMQFASNGYSLGGDAVTLAGERATIRVGDGTTAGGVFSTTISAALTGDAQLVKSDFGTLILTGANSYAGGTRVDAGTLQGNAGSIRGDLVNQATVIFEQGGDAVFAGAISGNGETVKRGTGQLTLSGDSGGYAGKTTVAQGSVLLTGALGGQVDVQANGRLQVGNGDATGDLTAATRNDGTLIFARSDDYDYTGALSGSGALIKRGDGLLLLSGDYSYTGSTIVEGGMVRLAAALDASTNLVIDGGDFDLSGRDQSVSGLEGGSGNLILGDGNLAVEQSTDATFGGSITGDGSFTKTGDGTLNLTGTSSFTGDTIVNDGRLAVNGTLPGMVTVGSRGTIGGNGTIGGLVVQTGGTAAPGNSIGLLRVSGNVTFQAGSVYQVEIDAAGQGDRIAAIGTATIQGGAVRVLAAQGDYAPATSYTILSADGGVSGSFAGVTTNLAFLTPSLTYEPTAVKLQVLRNDISFADVAQTSNQCAAATATEQLGIANAIYGAVLRSDAEDARQAFDLLSGEVYAATRTMLVQDAGRPREAIWNRTASDEIASGIWMQAVGSWTDNDGNRNAGKLSYSTTGLLGGVDHQLGSGVRLGIAGGYTHSKGDIDARASHAAVDSGHVLAYLAGSSGVLRFAAGGGYSWSDIDTRRSVGVGAFNDAPTADYKGNVLQGFARLGAQLPLGGGAIEPFGAVAVVRERAGGFAERGGAAALSAGRENRTVTVTTLGLTLETPVSRTGWSLRAQGGWEHGFGDLSPNRTLSFAGGPTMQVQGAAFSRNAGFVDTGLVWRPIDRLVLTAGYVGRLGTAGQDHGGRIALLLSL